MAVNHVLLKEFHHEKKVPYFLDYAKKYTDSPMLVEIKKGDGVYLADKLLRAARTKAYQDTEHPDWKFLMWDVKDKRPKMPMGAVGHRWGSTDGKWNLELKDAHDGSAIDPALTFLEDHDEIVSVEFDDFGEGTAIQRSVPVKKIETVDGETVLVATVYDLLMAQYGVARGLSGDYPARLQRRQAILPSVVGKIYWDGPRDDHPLCSRMGHDG
jgi:nitrate reductase alpha subunit